MECLLWDSFLWLAFASASTDFHKEAPVDLTNSGHQSEPQRHWASLQRKPRMRKQLWINRVKIYTLTKISWYCNHSSVPPLKHMFLGPWVFFVWNLFPLWLATGTSVVCFKNLCRASGFLRIWIFMATVDLGRWATLDLAPKSFRRCRIICIYIDDVFLSLRRILVFCFFFLRKWDASVNNLRVAQLFPSKQWRFESFSNQISPHPSSMFNRDVLMQKIIHFGGRVCVY